MGDKKTKSGSDIAEGVIAEAGAGAIAKAMEGGTPEEIGAAAIVGGLKSGFKALVPKAVDLVFIHRSREQAMEAIGAELDEQMAGVHPEVTEKVQELVDDGDIDTDDLLTNLFGALSDWQELYASARTSHMRRLILAVLINSFDKDAYQSGVRRRVYRVLQELDYAEVRFLAHDFLKTRFASSVHPEFFDKERWKASEDRVTVQVSAFAARDGTEPDRDDVLAKTWNDCLTWLEPLFDRGTEYSLYLSQLERLGLVTSDSFGSVSRTWLGDQVVALCKDTESLGKTFREHGADPQAEADDE